MKIPVTPPASAPARPAPNPNKTDPRRNVGANEGADAPNDANGAAGRDFASVLEDVGRPRERAGSDDDAQGETFDAKTGERAEGESEARRREGREGGGGEDGGDARGGFDQRSGLREVAARQEGAGVRAILHIADLERIVSAVRTQTLAGGVREVTLELRRSVLDGLRVKLSLDGSGRVSAEFIAASERVRAQLDARTPELAELLRSRGLNLASLRTSVGADASNSERQGGGHDNAPTPAAARSVAPSPETIDGADEPDSTDMTYRA